MIHRIFKVIIVPELKEEFEEKYKVVSLALVADKEGMLSAQIGKSINVGSNEYMMVSVWEDIDAVKKFAGKNWQESVIPEEMKKFVVTHSITHYQSL